MESQVCCGTHRLARYLYVKISTKLKGRLKQTHGIPATKIERSTWRKIINDQPVQQIKSSAKRNKIIDGQPAMQITDSKSTRSTINCVMVNRTSPHQCIIDRHIKVSPFSIHLRIHAITRHKDFWNFGQTNRLQWISC